MITHKPIVTFTPEGRAGNFLFKAAAAIAYAHRHGLDYTMPTESRDPYWCPLYLQHLVKPINNRVPFVALSEKSPRYAPLNYKPAKWESVLRGGYNIKIDGYRQSEKYFADYKAEVIKAFGFPWKLKKAVACHVRLGDARKYPEKHYLLSKEYYEEQMAKFPGYIFCFYSDEIQWCRDNFGNRLDCLFEPLWNDVQHPDRRAEVQDLIAASCCEHLIGSASTYAIWIGLLNQNPNARRIFPTHWMVPGWEGHPAEDWLDVIPEGWERA